MSTASSKASPIAPLMKDGSMTMVALDQRGSLRTIIANGRDESEITDQDLIDFKAAGAEVLAPLASAVLLDSVLGRKAIGLLPAGVPLILSADKFEQKPGGPVDKADLDPAVTPALIEELNPAALKLLVIWNQGSGVEFRRDLVGRFVELARATGRIALVEGIVRNDRGGRFTDANEFGEAVLEAAQELVAPGPDVYKSEVPGYLPGQFEAVGGFSRRLTEALSQPWIVLSNGVVPADFAKAVQLCCEGGASGFLAGRAIWSDAASRPDPAGEMRRESLPRLRELVEIVRTARANR